MSSGICCHHVIQTRFNLATVGRESAIRNRPGWLEERFRLFERHCLPSVAAQTRTDFTWLIYFDIDTPPVFRERIERNQQIFPFTPYFTPLFRSEGWPRSVREALDSPAQWLLTTRLDNDDAISTDFVERLREAVDAMPAPRRCSLNFPDGFLLQSGKAYAHRHLCNPFASWLEPWDDAMRTAYSIHHMKMAEAGEVIQIDSPGTWLQVIHGGNVSNRLRGRQIVSDALRSRFPAEAIEPLVEQSDLAIAFDNTVLSPVRALRDMAIGLVRRHRA